MNEIKELLEDGIPIYSVKKILNIEESAIIDYFADNHFQIKKEIFSKDRIIELYKLGATFHALHEKFSKPIKEIENIIDDVQIRRPDLKRKYTVDEHIFDNIDSIEKAYWLGFLYADVYNNQNQYRVNLTLAYKDYNHIKKYADFLSIPEEYIGYTEITAAEMYKYRTIKPKNYDPSRIYKYCNVSANSKLLSDSLAKHGCFQAKSHLLKYPYWLREDLQVHFIRGIFDGDGCITRSKDHRYNTVEWKWHVMSTKEVCDGINFYINKYTGKTLSVENSNKKEINDLINNYDINDFDIKRQLQNLRNKNTYTVYTTGNEKIDIICQWIWGDYTNESVLDRKLFRVLELREKEKVFHEKLGRNNYYLTDKDKDERLSEADKYVELYNQGVSATKIAEKFNVGVVLVLDLLKQKNVTIVNNTNRTNQLYQDYFNVIDTEEKVYWLSYLYFKLTKSNINDVGFVVELAEQKGNQHIHIKKLANAISPDPDNLIKYYNSSYNTYKIYANSVKMTNKLLYYFDNIEFNDNICDIIDTHFIKSFIQGAFDSAGTMKINSDGVSHISFYKKDKHTFKLKNIIKQESGVEFNIDKTTTSNLFKAGKQTLLFLKWLYKDGQKEYQCDSRFNKCKQFLV